MTLMLLPAMTPATVTLLWHSNFVDTGAHSLVSDTSVKASCFKPMLWHFMMEVTLVWQSFLCHEHCLSHRHWQRLKKSVVLFILANDAENILSFVVWNNMKCSGVRWYCTLCVMILDKLTTCSSNTTRRSPCQEGVRDEEDANCTLANYKNE